ncbi:hypothetical protein [Rhodococcus opacus]|uniref:hypothetical protein n=1 Tax=Rhodococcus opacus TaxID=37919 RepID=UPI00130062B1
MRDFGDCRIEFVDVVGEFLLVGAADLLTWLSAHPRRSLVEAGAAAVSGQATSDSSYPMTLRQSILHWSCRGQWMVR